MEIERFSAWMNWTERSSYSEGREPGVYALALFEEVTSAADPADPIAEALIYIGESTKSTLIGRWRQFDGTAFGGSEGHYGGKTYRERIGDDGGSLYVAAWSADGLMEPARSVFIKYLERRLLWEFVQRWNRLPTCNNR